MSHEIENMFSVKATPWHGLGTILHEAPTTALAIKEAGLDWQVKKSDLMTTDGQRAPAIALQRSTDGHILGVVGTKYHPLQNEEAFSFFDGFLEAKQASLETAGSLRGGRRVWILARLQKAPLEIVKGKDVVEKFLLLSNSHDGTMAVRVGFTPIRVVCANTLAMSLRSTESQLLRVKHSMKVRENVDKIKEIVNAANAQFEATGEQFQFLASREISKKGLHEYVKVVFDLGDESERREMASDRIQDRIEELFKISPGADVAGTTWWGAYNAVNYYLNYEASKTQDTRLNRLWFGSLKRQNEHALRTAVRVAGG